MQKLLNLIGHICFCFHLGFLYWFLYRFCIVFCIESLFPAPVGWQAMISSLTCSYTFVFWTVVLEKILRVSWTARRSNQSILKEISPGVHRKGWCWSWNSSTLATWCEELTHWKRPWCWERFRAGGEGDDQGWDGWMASLTQWTWVWLDSWSWWWTGSAGVLQSMGLQRVRHDWATELTHYSCTFV